MDHILSILDFSDNLTDISSSHMNHGVHILRILSKYSLYFMEIFMLEWQVIVHNKLTVTSLGMLSIRAILLAQGKYKKPCLGV